MKKMQEIDLNGSVGLGWPIPKQLGEKAKKTMKEKKISHTFVLL